ncbi:MAG: hypothetical protein AAFV88_26245, partial [Planctomycetota bacterium]
MANQDPNEFELRATAFVLGELSSEDERVFQEKLAHSSEQQKTVESIRQAVMALETELQNEPVAVTDKDRERIEDAMAAVPGADSAQGDAFAVPSAESKTTATTADITQRPSSKRVYWSILAVAACLLIMASWKFLPAWQNSQIAQQSVPSEAALNAYTE